MNRYTKPSANAVPRTRDVIKTVKDVLFSDPYLKFGFFRIFIRKVYGFK